MNAIWVCAGLLMAAPLLADTIYFRGGGSINGVVKALQKGEVSLQARFPKGYELHTIKLADIKSIQFNDEYYNQGEPSTPPRPIGPPDKPHSAPPPPAAPPPPRANSDIVVLQDSPAKACDLLSIDGQFVHCAGRDGDLDRARVVRIEVRPR